MNDIAPTLVGDSNQLSKSDLMDGPQTFTVSRVDINLSDKKRPTTIHLVEAPGKPYKPSLGMRKLIAKGWGKSSKAYIGRRLTLFHNPDVLWQGKREGGVEVCAMSDIETPFTIQVAVNAKQAKTVKVDALPDAPATDPWQPRWAQIEQALRGAGVSGDGPAILKAAGGLIEAEFTHPQQITDDQARAIHAALNPDAATVATDNPENKEN